MRKLHIAIALVALLCFGCVQPKPPVKSTAEADLKLDSTLRNDYKIENVLISQVGNTKIISVTLKEPIFHAKVSKRTPASKTSKESYGINYLSTAYENGSFVIEYDITKRNLYPPSSPGYASAYSQEFRQLQQNLLQVVHRSYGDLDGSSPDTTPPEFIQLYITDIKTGIRSATLMYYPDLKGALSMPPSIPQDEYMKRSVSDMTGKLEYVDDIQHLSIAQESTVWSDFLAKQLKTRISFMLAYSSFPPEGNIEEFLLQMASDSLKVYPFEDYSQVILKDLKSGEQQNIDKDKLPPPNQDKIKVHHLKFF